MATVKIQKDRKTGTYKVVSIRTGNVFGEFETKADAEFFIKVTF